MHQYFIRSAAAVASALVVAALAVTTASHADTSQDYVQSIEEWHQGRVERLKRGDGWLSLVGLFHLSEGEHHFGSAEGNDFVFPDKAPPRAGSFRLEGEHVRLTVEPGVEILCEDRPVNEMELRTDRQDSTTVLAMGSFRFYVIERGGRLYVRVKDVDSEAPKRFRGIDRYPVDEAWRVEARFEAYDPPKMIHVPDILGDDIVTECPGVLVFTVNGTECRLEPMAADAEEMFVVFGDETSGRDTYGGGRFVYVPAPDEDGRVVIDFNRAYNPPCAFNAFATCPLPHRDNVLPIAVTAGEKDYKEGH